MNLKYLKINPFGLLATILFIALVYTGISMIFFKDNDYITKDKRYVFRKMKNTVEPTIISLNLPTKKRVQNEKRARSIIKSPVSQQNLRTTSWEDTRLVKIHFSLHFFLNEYSI